MNKGALVEAVSDICAAWELTIAELGPQGLERPNATGDWRARDVLAHFNGWDRWQLVQLRCVFSGVTPTDDELSGGITYPPNDDMAEDAMNAMFMAGTRDMPTEDIVAHWRELSAMRAEWVAAADQDQLDAVIGGDWSSGTNRIMRLASEVPSVSPTEHVWERILDQVEHQRMHLQTVREWMGNS